MKVYSVLYCPCVFESGYVTLSIHKSAKGAYNKFRELLLKEYNEYREMEDFRKKEGKHGYRFKFLENSKFKISKTDLRQ